MQLYTNTYNPNLFAKKMSKHGKKHADDVMLALYGIGIIMMFKFLLYILATISKIPWIITFRSRKVVWFCFRSENMAETVLESSSVS